MNSEGWVIYINFAVVRIEDIDVVWPCVCLRYVLSVGLCSQYSHKNRVVLFYRFHFQGVVLLG